MVAGQRAAHAVLIQLPYGVARTLAIADLRQHLREGRIALAVNDLQLDGKELQAAQRMRGEELRRGVARGDRLAIRRSNDGRKLEEIADQDHLHAAEWLLRFAVEAEEGVNAIEDVCAH